MSYEDDDEPFDTSYSDVDEDTSIPENAQATQGETEQTGHYVPVDSDYDEPTPAAGKADDGYVSDPELLKLLNATPADADKDGYVSDPELLKQLNGDDGYITDPELLK